MRSQSTGHPLETGSNPCAYTSETNIPFTRFEGQYRFMPAKAEPSSVYQLKITLLEIDPSIWRRIHVPSTLLVCSLHDAIQAVMGWTDSHLHQFEKGRKIIGAARRPMKTVNSN